MSSATISEATAHLGNINNTQSRLIELQQRLRDKRKALKASRTGSNPSDNGSWHTAGCTINPCICVCYCADCRFVRQSRPPTGLSSKHTSPQPYASSDQRFTDIIDVAAAATSAAAALSSGCGGDDHDIVAAAAKARNLVITREQWDRIKQAYTERELHNKNNKPQSRTDFLESLPVQEIVQEIILSCKSATDVTPSPAIAISNESENGPRKLPDAKKKKKKNKKKSRSNATPPPPPPPPPPPAVAAETALLTADSNALGAEPNSCADSGDRDSSGSEQQHQEQEEEEEEMNGDSARELPVLRDPEEIDGQYFIDYMVEIAKFSDTEDYDIARDRVHELFNLIYATDFADFAVHVVNRDAHYITLTDRGLRIMCGLLNTPKSRALWQRVRRFIELDAAAAALRATPPSLSPVSSSESALDNTSAIVRGTDLFRAVFYREEDGSMPGMSPANGCDGITGKKGVSDETEDLDQWAFDVVEDAWVYISRGFANEAEYLEEKRFIESLQTGLTPPGTCTTTAAAAAVGNTTSSANTVIKLPTDVYSALKSTYGAAFRKRKAVRAKEAATQESNRAQVTTTRHTQKRKHHRSRRVKK